MLSLKPSLICVQLFISFVNCIYIEDLSASSYFRFGIYHLNDVEIDNKKEKLWISNCIKDELLTEKLHDYFSSSKYLTLVQAAGIFIPINEHISLSHEFNYCAMGKSNIEKEFYFQCGLALLPTNVLIAKNLGYILEWHGYFQVAIDIYRSANVLSPDLGVKLHEALSAPTLLMKDTDKYYVFNRSLTILQSTTLEKYDFYYYHHHHHHHIVKNNDELIHLFRELPLNNQYIGIPPSILYEHVYKILQNVYKNHTLLINPSNVPNFNKPMNLLAKQKEYTVHLGIISEHFSNSSPGLCILSILELLVKKYKIKLIYFEHLNTNHGMTLFIKENLAHEFYYIDFNNLTSSKDLILKAEIDILLYLALPTQKYTFLLSHLRLARVQIQYGIGHPFSSGSASLDYSIISSKMLPKYTDKTIYSDYDLYQQNHAYLYEFFSTTNFDFKNIYYYTEQLVLFDSLGYFLDDPMEEFGYDKNEFITGRSSCEDLDEYFQSLGVYPNISSQGVGCTSVERNRTYDRAYHIYASVQLVKKMHPLYDQVLVGIIRLDPLAKILLLDKARSIIPRLLKQLNSSNENDIYRNFVFLPRAEHKKYINMLLLSSIFLNPFPFGSGITSSEALATCLPVVVLTSHSSILPIAMSQVKSLGREIEDLLLVDTMQEYIAKSVNIVNGIPIPLDGIKNMICSNKHKLFGYEALEITTQEWFGFLSKI